MALRWQVRSARVTAFHYGKPAPTSWWQLLHGAKAARTSKRGAFVEESGLIEGQRLILMDQPNRMDVVLTPGQGNAAPELPVHSIGTIDAVSRRMSQLALKLATLAEFPTANRLAFGVSLFQASSGRLETIEELAHIFPGLSRELQQSTDFVFQINHPAQEPLGDGSVEINYLQKWFFSHLKLDGGTPTGPIEAFTANVELDISTGISSTRRWSANEAVQIIPRLIRGAKRVLEESR